VYAPAIANFTVSKKTFTTSITSPFDNTVTDKMNYNDAQDALITAYKNQETIDKKALYLFFLKENTTHSDIKGHMPFNRQFGFIYAANQSITELTRTMAHELGHGAFRLKHTFSNENNFVQDQGQTPNLMDYASGSELLKYQWDECHDFDLGCNWFEDGDEAEINDLKNRIITSFENKIVNNHSITEYYEGWIADLLKYPIFKATFNFVSADQTPPKFHIRNMTKDELVKAKKENTAGFYGKRYVALNQETPFGFTPSVIFEEIFHAGQSSYYGGDNEKTNVLMETEAKLAKVYSIYSSLSKEGQDNNTVVYNKLIKYVERYELNFIIDPDTKAYTFNLPVKHYFFALQSNNKALIKIYEKDFREAIRAIAKQKLGPVYKSTFTAEDFDDYNGETKFFDFILTLKK
jgi:hypothetical protein